MPAEGLFGWKRRMGVHQAYHQSLANRVVHWLCIPVELFGVIKLLSAVELYEVFDLALAVILLLAPIYLLTEVLLGSLMVAALLGLWWIAQPPLTGSVLFDAGLGLAAFVVAFVVQTQVGHRFEPEARDDTDKNMAEFKRTRNPVPLLLIFYYHLVEVLLALGYRPGLKKLIQGYTEEELSSFD